MIQNLRLYQLISPNLPIGGFTYSQGLEWAVEQGWVSNKDQMADWLASVLEQSMTPFELPLLRASYQAAQAADWAEFGCLAQSIIAGRETRELRTEERQRGAALARLLPALDIPLPNECSDAVTSNQISGFAYAAAHWNFDVDALCQGYLWCWLEGACVAGIKLVPLGQTHGQQLMLDLGPAIQQAVADSRQIPRDDIGATTFAQALASARHETQYTRLYRS